MYAFAQRTDTFVVDEPLYGHYLRNSGALHPGADEVMRVMDCDANRVIRDALLGPYAELIELDWSFLDRLVNVLLIRDPAEMLTSLVRQLPAPTMLDTGLELQWQLFEHLTARGHTPPVLDARELLLAPEDVLRKLCQRIDIAFDVAMLHWPPGGRPEDGIWAKYWYHNLHRSSGFAAYRAKDEPVPGHVIPLYQACREIYDKLRPHVIRGDA
jgi:hypothetical protein